MLGSTSGLAGSSGEGGSSPHEVGRDGGGEFFGTSSIMSGSTGDDGAGGSGELFEGDRSTGGNRWPRQGTLALLKIRCDMDAIFRDSSLKGPLWEEVSRKMAELGYHRSAKKCKEKFENVYKYHKRTKDGRVGKSDNKTYKFFEQLEALESSYSPFPPRAPQSQPLAQAAVPVTMVIPASVTVTSSPHPSVVYTSTPQVQLQHQSNVTLPQVIQAQHGPIQMEDGSIQMEDGSSQSGTPSSLSLSGSDEEVFGKKKKRKRKWKGFFERLTNGVIDKQNELHKRFLDVVEGRERDRLVREEAWKAQEMGRLNREHQILVQERSMAAAKDAALMAFLQKLSDQQQIPLPLPTQIQTQTKVHGVVPDVTSNANPMTQPSPPQPMSQPQQQPKPLVIAQIQQNPVSLATPSPIQPPTEIQPQHPTLTQMPPGFTKQQALPVATPVNPNVDTHKSNNIGDNNQSPTSSSRWPKAEVEALINLRTKLDEKYNENGPKGPLWEEISSLMKNLGYSRNAKRCKEKWENINKYFKKVKESNKRRPEDSKTCPYFHQLDALYRGKTPRMDINTISPSNAALQEMKSKNLSTTGPIMARPKQQWPGQDPHRMEDAGSGNDSEEDGDNEDDDEGSGGFEIVANNSNNNAGNVKC